MRPPPPAFDPKSASCPSFAPPAPIHVSQTTYDIFPPDAPPEYYYYAYSTTDSSTTDGSTVVADGSVHSVSVGSGNKSTTVVTAGGGGGSGSEQSEWLTKRRRFSSRSRIIIGIFGMLVFLLIITSTIIWICNVVIFPQVHYSTQYSQNTRHMDHTHATVTPSSASSDYTYSSESTDTGSSLLSHAN